MSKLLLLCLLVSLSAYALFNKTRADINQELINSKQCDVIKSVLIEGLSHFEFTDNMNKFFKKEWIIKDNIINISYFHTWRTNEINRDYYSALIIYKE